MQSAQNTPPATAPNPGSRLAFWSVIALGALVFIALWFTDRKHVLDNENPRSGTAEAQSSSPASSKPTQTQTSIETLMGQRVPAAQLSPEAEAEAAPLRQTIAANPQAADQKKALAILTDLYYENGSLPQAALYAEALAVADPTPLNQYRAAYYMSLAIENGSLDAVPNTFQHFNARAALLFETYLRAHPNDLNAQVELAICQTRTAAPMEGILKLRDLAKANPRHYRANFYMGISALQTNQPDKAVGYFQAAALAEPQKPEPHYHLALAYLQLNQVDLVEASGRAALARAQAAKLPAESSLVQDIQSLLQAVGVR